MNRITLAQREALDVVKDMIDRSNTNVPEFGSKVMTLILGILNIDCRVEHTYTHIDGDKIIPIINPNDGTDNDRIQINIPNIQDGLIISDDAMQELTPWEPRVWYNQETEPKEPTAQELRYATEVSCTGDRNGIVYTTNTADVQYNGDFRDAQTSFNDK